MSNSEYIYFLNCVYQEFGLNLSSYEEAFLKRRIEQRLNFYKCDSYERYLNIIINDLNERTELLNVIGINVTEFFRDPGMWKVLANSVIPEVLEKNKMTSEPVFNFWSSACNTGEEPYSLAILIKEFINNESHINKISVLATDIKKSVIEKAQEKCFVADRIKNVGPNILSKYFASLGRVDSGDILEEQYQLNENIGQMIEFQEVDLLGDFNIFNMDIILCRNVLIYFTKKAQAELLSKFHKSLKPKGFLVLGKCETLNEEVSTMFRTVSNVERVYQKI